MNVRSVFLMSQGWTLLVRDEEDGLWRSPQGGIMRAKEAEESTMRIMTTGMAYWFKHCRDTKGGKMEAGVNIIRACVAEMVMHELRAMASAPDYEAKFAAFVASNLTEDKMLMVRDVLRMVLAMPDPATAEKAN